MLHNFSYGGLEFSIAVADGQTPEDAQHEHLLRVCPDYRWLAFRRALIATSEYQDACAIATTDLGQLFRLQQLNSALDFCCVNGAEPQEIGAFHAALAAYLQGLPDTTEGQGIASVIADLAASNLIEISSNA